MGRKTDKSLIAALDIGTAKVAALIGEITESQTVEVISAATYPTMGLKKGVVVNIEATVHSIAEAIKAAQETVSHPIQAVYTGISGHHIRSFNSDGIVAIRDHEVSQIDVNRVIEAAKAVAIPADQKIIHILPQAFTIDDQDGIQEPIGMSGVRLEAKVHMVTGSMSAAQNIVKCIRRCELDVQDMILSPLASSYAVLAEDEKALGVCLIDIGAGTTDVAVFSQGAILDTFVLPIAGDQITNDLAIALRLPSQEAEAIKLRTATLERAEVAPDVVIGARYEEILQWVKSALDEKGLTERLASGIVLTGGSALAPEAVALAQKIFQQPVRVGKPKDKSPIYSTAMGLLHYGLLRQQEIQLDCVHDPGLPGVWNKVKRWIQGNF